jgi:hypothetical protein
MKGHLELRVNYQEWCMDSHYRCGNDDTTTCEINLDEVNFIGLTLEFKNQFFAYPIRLSPNHLLAV